MASPLHSRHQSTAEPHSGEDHDQDHNDEDHDQHDESGEGLQLVIFYLPLIVSLVQIHLITKSAWMVSSLL